MLIRGLVMFSKGDARIMFAKKKEVNLDLLFSANDLACLQGIPFPYTR